MSHSTKGGNLKDFRIDHQQEISSKNLPSQSLKSRSQLAEWQPESSVDKLWEDWSDDIGEEIDLSQPISSKKQSEIKRDSSSPSKPTEEEATKNRLVQQLILQKRPHWSVQMALDERRMEKDGEIDFDLSFRRQEDLKRKTVEFALDLQVEFRRELELFNEARQDSAKAIHLYRISNTQADFMLFRNGVKMLLSAKKSGRIEILFNQYLGHFARNASHKQSGMFELEAHWGCFDQLFWSYRGDRVETKDIVRYFLADFVRQSYK